MAESDRTPLQAKVIDFTNPLATFRVLTFAIVVQIAEPNMIDEMQVDCGPADRGCTPTKPEQAPSSYG